MRKLGWVTVGFTYFLMVWGNLVSSTGSGLACPDWPTCHGSFMPTPSFGVFFEWGHRLLAFTATVLIVTTIYKVLTAKAAPGSALKRSGRVLLALLAVQIVLGGTTVLLGLSVTVSTIHLLIANIVLSGLIATATVITWGNPVVKDASDKLKRLSVIGLGGMVIQLALGALVRHGHAGLACPNFPGCLSGFFPDPFTFETAVAFFHRWWGILMLGIFVHLPLAARKQSPSLAPVAWGVMLLSLAQVGLGILTVLSGLQTHARATHAAVGYALWAGLFYLALRSGGFRFMWKTPKLSASPA
ncbi:MAG: COX15/CtaA family protein [Bdellovibrionota bacterium]